MSQPYEKNILRLRGIKPSLASFMFCAGTEATVGLWGASYLVFARGVSVENAALLISLYYGGITIGRFATGFISFKVSNRVLILAGQVCAIVGVVFLLVPISPSISIVGLLIIGLGLAPIYPGLLHETPRRFGKRNSARLKLSNGGSLYRQHIFSTIIWATGRLDDARFASLYYFSLFNEYVSLFRNSCARFTCSKNKLEMKPATDSRGLLLLIKSRAFLLETLGLQ
ncbi:permease [Bacillus sp. JCM 19046]|nr:permease [Bacillus sp. JCM 19046]